VLPLIARMVPRFKYYNAICYEWSSCCFVSCLIFFSVLFDVQVFISIHVSMQVSTVVSSMHGWAWQLANCQPVCLTVSCRLVLVCCGKQSKGKAATRARACPAFLSAPTTKGRSLLQRKFMFRLPKYFLFHPSHRIFRRMHGALNVGKKEPS
jgi:hypothetical protein